MGRVYLAVNNHSKALEKILEAFEIIEKSNDQKNIAIVLQNIGNAYKKAKNYSDALNAYHRSRDIFLKIPELRKAYTNEIAQLYHDIGESYSATNLHKKALEHYDKAIIYYRKKRNLSGEAYVLLSIAKMTKSLEVYDHALVNYQKARDIFKKFQTLKKDLIQVIIDMGDIHVFKKDITEAIKQYNTAFGMAEKNNYLSLVAKSKSKIANIYKKNNELQKALEEYERSLKALRRIIGKGKELLILNAEIFRNIADVYLILGDKGKSLKSLEEAKKYYQLSKDVEKMKEIQDLINLQM